MGEEPVLTDEKPAIERLGLFVAIWPLLKPYPDFFDLEKIKEHMKWLVDEL